MTKQEILDAFIQAEKDWDHTEKGRDSYTHRGLCFYFWMGMMLHSDDVLRYLMPYWEKYKTREENKYHFNGLGVEPQGRAERLYAIRKVINDLKSDLWDL